MDMDTDKSAAALPAEHGGADQDAAAIGDHADHPLTSKANATTANGDDQATTNGQKPNPKDPSRPRRKKARRACFACQRAHLTCGDERPCQRCIKRGLQDACHDGVRKKAKYLHDAPDGALMPGVGGNNFYNNSMSNGGLPSNGIPINGANTINTTTATQQNSGANFYPTPQSNYNMYQENTINQQSTFPSQSPVSPTFSLKTNPTHRNSTGGPPNTSNNTAMTSSMPQPSTTGVSAGANQTQNPFAGPFFDPSDPALFNFDLSSMNFENRYGALEFGMLGHMATGAGDSPDSGTHRGSMGRSGSTQFASTPITGAATFGESPGNQQPFMFGDPLLNEWPSGQASGQAHVNVGVYPQNQGNVIPGHLSKADAPHAFAIESGPASFTSPGAAASPQLNNQGYDEPSPFNNVVSKSNGLSVNGQQQRPPTISTPSLKHQSLQMNKRQQRNPSAVYESVKEPYAYTTRFHNLTAFIQRRFSPQKTLQIAKALASIRPDDLIFMERCFQRTLWEYQDFINACGTPTIVCRRTGEVAAVGKEFSKEPNLNVNTGGSSAANSRNYTPRGSAESSTGRPHPVFLAELLDDDSVVEFYEDFARLAFGDSRGSTKEDMDAAQSDDANSRWNNHLRKGGIANEAGMNQLGFKDGKVECAYCWTVKRDVFDIPMLIVMNVRCKLFSIQDPR
ncbi:transcription activator of gluconeogenesis acuK [Aspergillus germanicus]